MIVLSWILPFQQPSLKLQQKVYSFTLITPLMDIRTTDRWQHRQSHETYYCATWLPQNGKIYIAVLHSSKANQNQHIGGVYKG